ncbi:hypothetical protein VitviT2T_015493 [Vitis vinifera]|uniref:Retrotransposon gag domain-containing protein n=1 Tax=Vitis vinifera TaxID=29760 RepID=A0ABY9CNM0_VITVI|nr:hypothetical protein VitviT2T_015493 [Vitis vinifera]
MPFTLHSQTGVASPPITVPTPTSEDPHARMDRLEQGLRQLRTSDRATTWEGFDGVPVASLPSKFRMPNIERYTGIGCPRLHLRLYSTVMRAHGLDEPQMITLFPLSLSGVAQRWFASLEASRRRTWDDLAQEFLRQFSFNTVVDVSRRELEALRQRAEESVSSFISRWRGKIAEIIDRPSERDQIQMVLRSLQSRIAKHVVGAPFTDFGSLVMALYDVEDGISRGLWTDSSPSDVKGKKPFVGPRPADRQFSQIGVPLSQALQKLTEAGLLTALTPRPPPQPLPPHFRTNLCCAYHQGSGHETDQCTALRHAIQDLIDQGLVHLGQPSVTQNPLPAHTTHAVPPPDGGIHFLDFVDSDDHVCTMSWDDMDPEPIELDDIYEMSSMSLGPQVPTHFRLFPETASVHASIVEPPTSTRYSVQTPFVLVPDVEEFQAPHRDDPQTPDVQYILRGGRVLRQPPLTAAVRPLGGTSSQEEVRAEDDEILRQLQSTQARISIWSLLTSFSTHRDALTRALSQIRVDTTTTPEGLIHMMTASRATCIVFSDDDLSLEGSDHTRPLYVSVGCSGRRVPSVLLDNGSALNVCPLATAITLGYAPSNFGPSTQTVQAYDSTRREVMGTLEIELLIGPTTFITIFQVLRIPTSFNLLLGRPWIHRAGVIPSSLHQKVKFIHEGQVVAVQSAGDMFISAEPMLQISHSDDDLLLTGFTFDEVQTLELEDFCRDFVAMSFDQHGSTVVLDMMRDMSYLPGMGLGRRQHGPSEFITIPDHDVPFGLGFIPIEADYLYMARLRKERVRARLTHMSFYYPVRPYTRSLADYFVRASEPHASSDGIIRGLSTTQEVELQRLVQ